MTIGLVHACSRVNAFSRRIDRSVTHRTLNATACPRCKKIKIKNWQNAEKMKNMFFSSYSWSLKFTSLWLYTIIYGGTPSSDEVIITFFSDVFLSAFASHDFFQMHNCNSWLGIWTWWVPHVLLQYAFSNPHGQYYRNIPPQCKMLWIWSVILALVILALYVS